MVADVPSVPIPWSILANQKNPVYVRSERKINNINILWVDCVLLVEKAYVRDKISSIICE